MKLEVYTYVDATDEELGDGVGGGPERMWLGETNRRETRVKICLSAWRPRHK